MSIGEAFWLGFFFGVPTGIAAMIFLVLLLARMAEGRPYMPGPFARPDWTEHYNRMRPIKPPDEASNP